MKASKAKKAKKRERRKEKRKRKTDAEWLSQTAMGRALHTTRMNLQQFLVFWSNGGAVTVENLNRIVVGRMCATMLKDWAEEMIASNKKNRRKKT